MNPISLLPTPGPLGLLGAEPPAAVVAAPADVGGEVAGVSLASLFDPHAASASAPTTSSGESRLMFTSVLFWRPLPGRVGPAGCAVADGGGAGVADGGPS